MIPGLSLVGSESGKIACESEIEGVWSHQTQDNRRLVIIPVLAI
jgi:hypothetical protein